MSERVIEELKNISEYPPPYKCSAIQLFLYAMNEIRNLKPYDFMKVLEYVRKSELLPDFKRGVEKEYKMRKLLRIDH